MRDLRVRKRIAGDLIAGLTALLAATSPGRAAFGQSAALAPAGSESGPRVLLVSPGLPPTRTVLSGRQIRSIEDPNLGQRWLLLRDPDHPGGPGRLLQVAAASSGVQPGRPANPTASAAPRPQPAALRPIIHAGDRLVLEENSAVAVVRLEAVALESAPVGSAFRARLKIGGKAVHAVALATGRAAFQPGTWSWR